MEALQSLRCVPRPAGRCQECQGHPPQPQGSKKYRSDTARGEVDRHVSNLIVIVPNDDDKSDDDEDKNISEAELEKAGE